MQRSDLVSFGLPDTPGVYRFWRDDMLLYVGKATSLKDRVRSYFSDDLIKGRGIRIHQMVVEANKVTWEETDSVLEALILEAALIKELQPPYNVREKDNKSFNYLVVTKEEFPRVLVVRGRELAQSWNKSDTLHVFGPFPQGGALKEAMKLVRKIFPFRDKCEPLTGKPCFNAQIGLCPGVCNGSINAVQYADTIHHIALLFKAKKKALLVELSAHMDTAASEERFEDAARIRRQIAALTHIRDVALIKEDVVSDGGAIDVFRIEAYDIAHISGKHTVGVMTVIEYGEPQKRAYRKFIVRDIGNDDAAALRQVVERRMAHQEWPLPRLIVADGGDIQLNTIRSVLAAHAMTIPVVAVTKDERHKARDIIGDKGFIESHRASIILANTEAHRFAVTFHRARRTRSALGTRPR
jgi:excinuclease UvrABC nuclease subunit